MNKVKKENGVLSSQEIFDLINNNIIYSDQDIDKEIIQPASIAVSYTHLTLPTTD